MLAIPVSGKRKSADICAAFVRGAKGQGGDAAVFYGVDDSNVVQFRKIRASKRPWFYIDNSYFDCARGTHYRITKNGIQHSGLGVTTGARLRDLGVTVKRWRENGEHILVCPQSADFMDYVIGSARDWTNDVTVSLRLFTKREIRIREWNRDKIEAAATIANDLRSAWALVTYSSAAAISALIEGVPVFSMAGAAALMSGKLSEIEAPFMPYGRERFLGVLADNQWTLDEIASGSAWRALHS